MSETSGRWINDQEDHPSGGLGQRIHRCAQRPDRPAVADPRAAAPDRETTWQATPVQPSTTRGRSAVAAAGRRPVAGCARTPRALAVDLSPVSAVAARTGLATAVDAAAGLRRRRRVDQLAGGLHDQPRPPARRRRPPPPRAAGRATRQPRASRAGRSRVGRSRGGWTTKIHLACEQGRGPLSLVVTAGQRGDSPQFTVVLGQIRVPRLGPGRPRTRPDRVLADKAY